MGFSTSMRISRVQRFRKPRGLGQHKLLMFAGMAVALVVCVGMYACASSGMCFKSGHLRNEPLPLHFVDGADDSLGRLHSMSAHSTISSMDTELRSVHASEFERQDTAPLVSAADGNDLPSLRNKVNSLTVPDVLNPPQMLEPSEVHTSSRGTIEVHAEAGRASQDLSVQRTHGGLTAPVLEGPDKPHSTSPDGSAASSDDSPRCKHSGICDGLAEDPETCQDGPDGLGCVLSREQRREHVVGAIQWAWKGYRNCSWGEDELMPISCGKNEWFGLGITLVDSLDTLMLAGLDTEVEEALVWIATELPDRLESRTSVSLFETTIRIIGGLLAAAHIKNDPVVSPQLLKPAAELSVRLLSGFDTDWGVPQNDVNLKNLTSKVAGWTPGMSSILSEAASVSIEFSHVAKAASYSSLATPAMKMWDTLNDMPGKQQGLLPVFINIGSRQRLGTHGDSAETGIVQLREHKPPFFTDQHVTMGGLADSAYEYMLKQYILDGKKDRQLLDMYTDAMRGMRNLLVEATDTDGMGQQMYLGDHGSDRLKHAGSIMEHLACFVPGMLALGHYHGIETGRPAHLSDLDLAERFMHTCYEMYRQTSTGVAPDAVTFNAKGPLFTVPGMYDENKLRPEAVESLFILYRVTGNTTYVDWGWQIFRAFEMHSKWHAGGYTGLKSVWRGPAHPTDKMESFFIAETLKYFWLLFSPTEVLPLDEYVFNTEAHPLPIFGTPAEISHSSWYLKAPEDQKQPIPVDSKSLFALLAELRVAWASEE